MCPPVWWEEFATAIQSHCVAGTPIIIGIDGNTRCFSDSSGAVGDLVSKKKEANACFGAMVKSISCDGHSNAFKVVNTFSCNCAPSYCGNNYTYITKEGVKLCNDYVITSAHVDTISESFQRMPELNVNAHDDHMPVRVDVCLPTAPFVEMRRSRKPGYDIDGLRDPLLVEECKRRLRQCKPIQVDAHVTSHCHLMEHEVYEVLCDVIPKQVGSKTGIRYSKSTLQSITEAKVAAKVKNGYQNRGWKSTVRACFRTWKFGLTRLSWSQTFGFSSMENIQKLVYSTQHFKDVTHHKRAMIKLDKYAQFMNLVDDATDSVAHHHGKVMSEAIGDIIRITKPAKAGGPSCRKVVVDDGIPARDRAHEARIFREHFCKQLGGKVRPFEELLDVDECPDDRRLASVDPLGVTRTAPSCARLAAHFRGSKKGKACSENLLKSDIYKIFSEELSEIYYPLVLKTYVRIQHPLQNKGGVLKALFKKGMADVRSNYRDITLASDGGKRCAINIRHKILPIVNRMSRRTQFGGGINGGETSIVYMYNRLIADLAKLSRLSHASISVDVVTAFASLMRSIIFGNDDGCDEAWLAQLRDSGFEETQIKAIYQFVKDLDYLNKVVDSESGDEHDSSYAFKIVEQLYTNTWVSMDYIYHILHTTKGAGAGTPNADLVFSAVFAVVLNTLHDALDSDGLIHTFEATNDRPEVKCIEGTYVDDGVFPVIAPPLEIETKVAKTCEMIVVVFSMFFVEVNFGPNKTETTISIDGDGAKGVRVRLLGTPNPIIKFEVLGECKHIRIVPRYKHVGVYFPDIGSDVATKIAIMCSVTKGLRKYICKCNDIPIAKRVGVMQGYILSKGLSQSGVWPELAPASYKKVHTCIMRLYRDMVGENLAKIASGCSVFTDEEVLMQHSFLCPMTILRRNRLLLFGRMMLKCSVSIRELAFCTVSLKKGWAASVASDLKWLTFHDKFSSMGDSSIRDWGDMIRCNYRKFSSGVKVVCASPLANTSAQWKVCPALAKLGDEVSCEQCSLSFFSMQAMKLHMFKAHGVKHRARMYVNRTHCLVCLREFWTRERAINHLRYRSSVCFENSLLRGPLLSLEDADALDSAEHEAHVKLAKAGKRSHHAAIPSVRLAGPVLPIFLKPGCESKHHPLGRGHNNS